MDAMAKQQGADRCLARMICCMRAKPQKPSQTTRYYYVPAIFVRDTFARGYVPDPPSLFLCTGGSGDETTCNSKAPRAIGFIPGL